VIARSWKTTPNSPPTMPMIEPPVGMSCWSACVEALIVQEVTLSMPGQRSRLSAPARPATRKSRTTARCRAIGGEPDRGAKLLDVPSVKCCSSSLPLAATRLSPNWAKDQPLSAAQA
jgi:hypothetical protein